MLSQRKVKLKMKYDVSLSFPIQLIEQVCNWHIRINSCSSSHFSNKFDRDRCRVCYFLRVFSNTVD